MNSIQTPTFEIAIYARGNEDAANVALVLPGKLDTKDYTHMRSHVDFLADLGYFALSFDPPGTWESSGEITLYNMTNYLKAVDEIIAYFGNRSTFVMGHSRGGAVATIAGASNPHVFAFASLMSSLSQEGFLEGGQEWQKKGYIVSKRDLPPGGGEKVKEFHLPYSFYEDQLQYRLTDKIVQSPKPKLFTLGLKDTLVPPQRIREAYSLYAQPKELYELHSMHDYRNDPTLIDEVNHLLEKFLSSLE